MNEAIDVKKTNEYQMGYREGYLAAQMEYLNILTETAAKTIKPSFEILIKTE
jgi:hypothetical protein